MISVDRFREIVAGIPEVKAGATVFTIGLGSSELFHYLSRDKQCRIYGVELTNLREKLPEVSVVTGNPFTMEYGVVFSRLEHVDVVFNFLKDPIRNFRVFDRLKSFFTSGTRTVSLLESRAQQEELIFEFAEKIPLTDVRIEASEGSLLVYGMYAEV